MLTSFFPAARLFWDSPSRLHFPAERCHSERTCRGWLVCGPVGGRLGCLQAVPVVHMASATAHARHPVGACFRCSWANALGLDAWVTGEMCISFLRNCQTVFQSGRTISHPCQHSALSASPGVAGLRHTWWCLAVVSICFPWWLITESSSRCCLPSSYLLWWISCSVFYTFFT